MLPSCLWFSVEETKQLSVLNQRHIHVGTISRESWMWWRAVFIWEQDRDWRGLSTVSHIHLFPFEVRHTTKTYVRAGTATRKKCWLKASSCNHLWSRAFKVIIMLCVSTKQAGLWGLRFIVHVNWFVLNGSNGKARFSRRCHTHTSCYVVIVLSCKVPFLFMSERAYATQSTPHAEWTAASVSAHGEQKWRSCTDTVTSEQTSTSTHRWVSLESDDDLSCASHQHWERLQCTAVCAPHPFDTLTQWLLKSACVRNSELIAQRLSSED